MRLATGVFGGSARTMLHLVGFAVMSGASLAHCHSLEGAGVCNVLPSDLGLLEHPGWDILVVELEQIQLEQAPVKTRPVGVCRVVETLRGRQNKGAQLHLVWREPSLTTLEEPDRYDRWKLVPGERQRLLLVVTTDPTAREPTVSVDGTFLATEANRQTALENMAPPERRVEVQTPLFLLLLGLPFVGLVVAVLGCSDGPVVRMSRGTARIVCLLLCVVEIPAYLFYESGISRFTDIRLDLMILAPGLVGTVLLLGVSCAGLCGLGPLGTHNHSQNGRP